VGSTDDLDLYAYTAGDPVNKIDPTGNDGWQVAGGILETFVGGAHAKACTVAPP